MPFDYATLRNRFSAAGLATQKAPARLVIVEALSRTALGKVRKAELCNEHFFGEG